MDLFTSVFSLSNFTLLYDAFRTAVGGVEWFVLAYFICLACFFIIGRDYMNDGFVYPFLFMALTVFNPFLIVPVAEVIGLLPRIRRLFWLMPVNLTLAFVLTCAVFAPRKRLLRIPAALCAAVWIIACGSGAISHFHMPDNIYKVSDSVVELSALIEEDADRNGLEVKRALYSDVNLLTLRLYDPSISSILRRSDLLDWSVDPSDEDAVNRVLKSGHVPHTLALVSRYGLEIDQSLFLQFMKKVSTFYVITEPARDLDDYLTSAGFEEIGSTGGYRVYRLLP